MPGSRMRMRPAGGILDTLMPALTLFGMAGATVDAGRS